jgi:hypothetical protein
MFEIVQGSLNLTEEFPTLLLSRRPRQPGVDWFGARS